MSDPQPIYAVTQFTGGTGATWRSLAQPVPAGVLTIESDTGIVKRGDGVTLYPNLPVFFNATYLQDVAVSAAAAAASAVAAALSAAAASAYSQQAELQQAVTASTTDATPTVLLGMGVIPNGISNQRIVGQVSAQNTASGDVAAWDISALAVRRGAGLSAAMPILPTVVPYYADTSMAACTLTLTVNTVGFILTAIGLPSTAISWNGRITFSGDFTAPTQS